MSKYTERLQREAAKRADKMRALRAKGWTLQQIADSEGISRQRVHQLLSDDPRYSNAALSAKKQAARMTRALLKGAKP